MQKFKRLMVWCVSAAVICTGFITSNYVKSTGVFDIPLYGESKKIFEEVEVIPGGNTIGIKLYTKGVLVVDTASFETAQGTVVCPASDSGILSGDTVLSINGKEITGNEMFIEEINKSGQNTVLLGIIRKDSSFEVAVTPAEATDKKYKIGTWVRDSAAGIGTMTFCRADTGQFAALGHGISDGDIGQQYNIREGSIENADVSAVIKGEKGVPGELKGIFAGHDEILGRVTENSLCGIYGKMNTIPQGEKVKTASKWEIREGEAQIICTVGDVKDSYSIEIQRIILNSTSSSKSMVIKITDERLLEKTGGIVQGMSGSPVIQNGKLIGAVTHVFVNDPTRGYGIFIENMLAEAEKIK